MESAQTPAIDAEDSDFIPKVRASFSSGSIPVYKLKNRNPKEPDPNFTPGLNIKKKVEDKWQVVETIPFARVVFLYIQQARKMTGAKGITKCESFDAHLPSRRIKEPMCHQAETRDIVKILSKFKGYDKAKIEKTTSDLTDSQGRLSCCGIQTNSGVISICPKARYNEDEGKAGPCKAYVKAIALDLDRQQEFWIDLGGLSIRHNKHFVSPYAKEMQFLAKHGLPWYSVKYTIKPGEMEGFFYVDFTDRELIEDDDERAAMKSSAKGAQERYMKMATYDPSMKKEESEKPGIASKGETPKRKVEADEEDTPPAPDKHSDEAFDDDDIPF